MLNETAPSSCMYGSIKGPSNNYLEHVRAIIPVRISQTYRITLPLETETQPSTYLKSQSKQDHK